MNKIGLDFGTTNSILSYYDENLNTIIPWKLGGASGRSYIPSFLSLAEDEIYIGEEAKNNFKMGVASTYNNFKILLFEKDKKILAQYNYVEKTPKEISKLYIKQLLERYIEEVNIKKIDILVLTVPEIWMEDDMRSRTIVKEIAEELKLPLKKLISEPVAAGAYFINNYKNKYERSYNGHLLIFDYGGGTLDISLLESKDEAIKTLARTGKGKSTVTAGKAGVAYDDHVVRKTYQEHFKKELDRNTSEYKQLIIDFERHKIDNKHSIDKNVKNYKRNEMLDKDVFSLNCDSGKLTIKSSHLVKGFDELLKEDITLSLNEISEYFKIHGINTNNHDQFRIVMVGGFSAYCLSKSAVKDFFNSKTESDSRFETHFTAEDTALAISKGAALLANDLVEIDETYPMSIGLFYYKMNSQADVIETKEVIFKKGDHVVDNDTKFSQYEVGRIGNINIFLDNGRSNSKIRLNKNPEDIFPRHDVENNRWSIGFSIDTNDYVFLHICDGTGALKTTELGDIVEAYKDEIIEETNDARTN